jgi:hypothetical protein
MVTDQRPGACAFAWRRQCHSCLECETVVVDEPRFAVLDVVEIADDPILAEQGLSGRRAVVTRIRRDDDGRYTYSVGGLDDDSEVGGLYPEECLLPTGERASAELFWLPGPFRTRDVVRVAGDYEFGAAAGRRAVLTDGYSEDPETGEVLLCVWIEEVGEAFTVAPGQLSPTGERLPPRPRGRVAHSTAVSTDGEIRGTFSFVIVDEIDQHL